MRIEAIHLAGNVTRLGMLTVAVLLMVNAQIALASAEQTGISSQSAQADAEREYPDSVAAPKRKKTKHKKIKKPVVRSVIVKNQIKSSDRLSLSLSMSLSNPGNASTQPGSPTNTSDAPQQGPAEKGKRLSALNAQIAEMEQMIQAQQSQLGMSTNPFYSSVATSGVLASSTAGSLPGVSGVHQVNSTLGNEQLKPMMGAPDANKDAHGRVEWLKMSWTKPAFELGLTLLLAVTGLVWYRRYAKTARQWKRGSFQHLSDVHDPELVLPSAIAKTVLTVDEQAVKTSVNDEQKSQSVLPPEYEMLEEADIYLRFGHDKLAEEALRAAIKINPRNQQAYVRLLRIYFAREDSAAFQAVAQHLKSLEDGMAWEKATEMGRNLDPGNALYH